MGVGLVAQEGHNYGPGKHTALDASGKAGLWAEHSALDKVATLEVRCRLMMLQYVGLPMHPVASKHRSLR